MFFPSISLILRGIDFPANDRYKMEDTVAEFKKRQKNAPQIDLIWWGTQVLKLILVGNCQKK